MFLQKKAKIKTLAKKSLRVGALENKMLGLDRATIIETLKMVPCEFVACSRSNGQKVSRI